MIQDNDITMMRRKSDLFMISLKMRVLLIFVYTILSVLCTLAPLWCYALILAVFLVEFTLLANEHLKQLTSLSIRSSEALVQRVMISLSVFNICGFSILSLIGMFMFTKNIKIALGFTPDLSNFNDPIAFIFILFKVSIIVLVVDKLYHFYNIRSMWKLSYKTPPITKATEWIICKLLGASFDNIAFESPKKKDDDR